MDTNQLTQLLARYGLDIDQPDTFRAAWTFPDDGYIHRYLIPHLVQLDRPDCIGIVLNAETPDGKNGWFQARAALGQMEGFIADVVQWRSLFRTENRTSYAQRYFADNIGAEVRSTLLLSTIRSLGFEHAAIESSSAPVDTGAQFTREQRTQVLQKALEVAQGIRQEEHQAQALIAVLAQLTPALLKEALGIARRMRQPWYRAKTLIAIAPLLSFEQQAPVVQEALRAAEEVRGEPYRSNALIPLLPHVRTKQALAIAREIPSEQQRSQALATIAPRLRPDLRAQVLREALSLARELPIDEQRSEALIAVLPHLNPEHALAVVQEIPTEQNRSKALAPLLPQLTPALLQEALRIAEGMQNEHYQSEILAAIVRYLPPEQALGLTRTIPAMGHQSTALQVIAHRLTPDLLEEASSFAWTIPDSWYRCLVLSAFLPRLPAASVEEFLPLAYALPSEKEQSAALRTVAPYLAPERALTIARTMSDIEDRFKTLRDIALHLPPEQQTSAVQEALELVPELEHDWERYYGLIALVPHLSSAKVSQSLEMARTIPMEEQHRSQALATIARYLPSDQQTLVLREALDLAREIEDDAYRAETLVMIALDLPSDQKEPVLHEALAILRESESQALQWEMLAHITTHLPTDQGAQLLQEALGVIQTMPEEHRAFGLQEVLVYLIPGYDLSSLRQTIPDEEYRSHLLTAIASGCQYHPSDFVLAVLDAIAQEPRMVALPVLGGLLPSLRRLGGEKAVAETALAIEDITRWWP